MLGTLEECLLFMYRCPVEAVRPLVPECLELVTYKGHAIMGVVVSNLKAMRPWPFPSWTGIGYRHVAYRIYVSFTPPGKQPIEGLYFLRSEANSSLMKVAGNMLTDFHYHRAEIEAERIPENNQLRFRILNSEDGKGNAEAILQLEEIQQLAPDSLFSSVKEAMDVLHYEPYGIFYDAIRNNINVVKVTRNDRQWKETPVRVLQQRWDYVDSLIPSGLQHELTVMVDSIPYRWERGREYSLE